MPAGAKDDWIDCTTYTSTGVQAGVMETFPCLVCPNGAVHVGPDLEEFDLINYDNHIIFDRELFDDAVTQMAHSETSLHAIYDNICATYIRQRKGHAFPSRQIFHKAMYAYMELLESFSGMGCQACGEEPPVIIIDGTVMTFSRKKLSGLLSPPTYPGPKSVDRPGVVHVSLAPVDMGLLGVTSDQMLRLRKLKIEKLKKIGSNDCPKVVEEILGQSDGAVAEPSLNASSPNLFRNVENDAISAGAAFRTLLSALRAMSLTKAERSCVELFLGEVSRLLQM